MGTYLFCQCIKGLPQTTANNTFYQLFYKTLEQSHRVGGSSDRMPAMQTNTYHKLKHDIISDYIMKRSAGSGGFISVYLFCDNWVN